MYKRKSRLSAREQGKLIDYFVAGATARAAAQLVGMQANTAIRFFMHLPQLIASKQPSYPLSGEIEADEGYFAGVRKGKRGRGAAGRRVWSSEAQREGLHGIMPKARTDTLLPIIEEKVTPHSIVYTDTFRAYDALDVSEFKHQRINHSELFADQYNHINGIENFGIKQSVICDVLMALKKKTFIGFSRNVNGASMEETISRSSSS